ncbi:hypothetical protein I302_103534 [Kwoniella bestiolae CBS 10118]|uniref:Major facilitator superfamily (MFS) profile domain-containing protein n=1 Tax=Kwoniella bestiolae CBS 10118 TaxID=1296100 RepID=A0A1B9G8Q8_9TREE|nr:hypothetical protein I302_02235 [Kwoniella bestiolae CBS 10118]OCF27393.1 hypothetical protein I302_02235 [Kwoniella bestiolae CBS 10118]
MAVPEPAELEISKHLPPNDVPALNSWDEEEEVDQAYLSASRSTKIFRGVLLQMVLFGTLSFVGPSLADAISGLGGGGLKDPDLANLAQALSSTMTCIVTLFGGPLINKIGIKTACIIASFAFFFTGSGYYVNLKHGIQVYLVIARVIVGGSNGFLYVAESTAMLSYPRMQDRGTYISIWSAMRNSGGIIGGAIILATNYKTSGAGAVSAATYLIFLGFEASGPIWSFLLSPTKRVRRPDGTRIPTSKEITWKAELKALALHFKHPRTWLMAIPSFYSFFFLGTYSTFLATHFSVRSRALASFLGPTGAVLTALLYGRFLDSRRFSQKTKIWGGMAMVLIPQLASFIWVGIEWNKYPGKVALDYDLSRSTWAAAYLGQLLMHCSGFCFQVYLYWILATFSNDLKAASRIGGTFRAFECAGQATSFGLVSKYPRALKTFYFNASLIVPALFFMVLLARSVPETPAEVDDMVKGLDQEGDEDVKGRE